MGHRLAPFWCMALYWCIGGVVFIPHPQKTDPRGGGPGAPQTLSFYIFWQKQGALYKSSTYAIRGVGGIKK